MRNVRRSMLAERVGSSGNSGNAPSCLAEFGVFIVFCSISWFSGSYSVLTVCLLCDAPFADQE